MGRLLEGVQAAVPSSQVQSLARLLGESPEATARALSLAATTLLAAAAERAGHGAMDDVMAAAGPLLPPDLALARMFDAIADPTARAELLQDGQHFAGSLLGDRLAPTAAALAAASGARGHVVAELLKFAGPIALAALHRAGHGPDGAEAGSAQALAGHLEAERPALEAALPSGLARLVGGFAAEPAPLHDTAVEGAAGSAASAARWLPWLAAAVVAILLLAGLRSCNAEQAEKAARPAGPTAMVTEVPGALAEVVLPDGSRMMLKQGSPAMRLAQLLAGTEALPQALPLAELSADPDGARTLGTVLGGWPGARAAIAGEGAADLRAALVLAGVHPDQLAADGAADGPLRLELRER